MKAQIAAFVVALAAWEGAAALARSPTLPGPLAVLRFLPSMDGLAGDLGASVLRVLVGYALAMAAGLVVGGVTGLSRRLGHGFGFVLNLLRPIPPIAWVPLAILWFGLGDGSAWFIVFVGAFFPIFVNVAWALANTPAAYLELARSVGASRWQILTRIRIPAAAPQIAAGLRTGLGLAWTSVIAAELVGAQQGLGYRIQAYRLTLDTEGVMACMACIGLCGYLMDLGARALERRFA
jgi:ABC-type nitrate/sulfonate/bicarbonate transport system permease component